MVKLKINGKEVTASPDKTILQVCKDQNLDTIPTLCYDEKLPPFGSCFLCVVEINNQSRLFPSCATKVAEGMDIQTRSDKVLAARKTCLELLVSDHYADCFGPCRLNCPADVDIQGYMSLINLGKFKEAVALIKEKNPLPSVCGRVCTRKCEINCRRSMVDAPVGIDFLKRYAADQDMIGEMWQPDSKPDNGHRVAIIGGGPAGLTAAYYLVIDGYRPTVFESKPKPGGMLRYGIPSYRLPREVIDKEIDWIANLGVEIKTETTLGKDITIDSLFKDGYEAVFVGLGAQVAKQMRVENEDVDGVLGGVDFLKMVEMKTAPEIKGRVVVVGGGNTAIDAARTSLRLGADEVILLYRRTRKEMPANEMEIVAAEEEGVKMEFLAAPVRVNSENGRMTSIEALRMELGAPDDSGRRRPVKIEGSEYTLDADWIISAIGQEPDLTGVAGDDQIEVTKWQTIEAKQKTFDTDRPGVFAGGDVVTGPADAIDAIAAGRMAARAIDKYIKTGVAEPFVDRFESKRDNFHKLTADDIPDVQRSDRHHMAELDVPKRITSFDEVETGYTHEDAIEESLRCAECGCDVALSCTLQDYCTEYGVDQNRFIGTYSKFKVDTRHPFIKIDSNKCIRCGRRVATCSEILNVSALGFVNRGFKTIVKPALEKALHETNCVACGNCIDVCPTGALNEKMPFRRSGPWKMESIFNVCNYCSVGCNITINAKTPDLFFVTGAPPHHGPNKGELCVKGRFGYQHYLDGSRKKKPMIKKDGRFKTVLWDEAFDHIKNRFATIREQHTAENILVAASPKMTNEELYLTGRLARGVIGTNSIGSFQMVTNGADYHALDMMLGRTMSTVNQDDIEKADLYIFLGGNPSYENPVLGWRLKRRMRHGAEAIVINANEIDLVRHATVWADARRRTSTTLLNTIMSELVRRDVVDSDYIQQHTANYEQFKSDLSKHDPQTDAAVTGVDPEKINQIVDLFSDRSKKVVAVYNLDSQTDRATHDLRALSSLMLMLGKASGGGSGLALTTSQCNYTGLQLAGLDSRLLPGALPTKHPGHSREVSAVWQAPIDKLTASGNGDIKDAIANDKIRAAIVIGENPAGHAEYNDFVNSLEFLVVADMFLTETAQAAEVFLPLAGYLEGNGHFTNWAGEVQTINPIGEPMTGLSNVDLLKKIANAFGGEMGYNSFDEITGELELLIKQAGNPIVRDGSFATTDGRAHFVMYSAETTSQRWSRETVIEIDARMHDRMKLIRA